jgi:hypothetical protein
MMFFIFILIQHPSCPQSAIKNINSTWQGLKIVLTKYTMTRGMNSSKSGAKWREERPRPGRRSAIGRRRSEVRLCRLPTNCRHQHQAIISTPATPSKRERVPPSSLSSPSHSSTVVHQASTRGRRPLLLQTANRYFRNFNINFNSLASAIDHHQPSTLEI